MMELEAAVRERAAPVIEHCKRHGVPNVKVCAFRRPAWDLGKLAAWQTRRVQNRTASRL
jgi:hypothetical protein